MAEGSCSRGHEGRKASQGAIRWKKRGKGTRQFAILHCTGPKHVVCEDKVPERPWRRSYGRCSCPGQTCSDRDFTVTVVGGGGKSKKKKQGKELKGLVRVTYGCLHDERVFRGSNKS